MIETSTLIKYLSKMLNSYNYSDYGPNGLQVQGSKTIRKIAFAVSATQDSIAKAVALEADALIVHHGLFWKFHGPKTITGAFHKRIAPLILNNINLIAYHLPLDGHIEVGNAASIAKKLNLKDLKAFGDYKGMPTGVKAKIDPPMNPTEFRTKLELVLDHQVLHNNPSEENISSIGIITGGANSDWIKAKHEQLDAYLTGEISEHDWHESAEDEIHYYAGGHNATEQFGVQSLMKEIHDKFGDKSLELFFIPSSNPA